MTFVEHKQVDFKIVNLKKIQLKRPTNKSSEGNAILSFCLIMGLRYSLNNTK